MSSTEPFIHLRVRTAYSLLEGAMTVDTLINAAKAESYPALAITDNHNLFGSMEFSLACIKAGIQPIIGCLFRYLPHYPTGTLDESDQVLLLASNQTGYYNLLKLVSRTYMNPDDDRNSLLSFETIKTHADGLMALSAGIYGGVGKALLRNNAAQADAITGLYKDTFGDRFYLEIMRHGLQTEQDIEAGMLQLATQHHVPIVATNDVYFHEAHMMEAHDALICTAEGRYVMEADRRRMTPEHRLKTPQEMQQLFSDLPEALHNTIVIAQRCAVMSPPRDPILPGFAIEEQGQVLSEADALRKRAHEGLDMRLHKHVYTPNMDETAKQAAAEPYFKRLDYELDVIIGMGFPGYFLIVSDFITWSKEHNIPVGPGRGSGAASVVAWSLLITDLDPLHYDLVFERFLNPERVSMPDFDIDFCQDRRDEVIRYVQHKYGRDRVAQIITFGKLQARAVLRDVGRVLQMPYGQVDRICKLVPNNPAAPVTLAQAIDIEPMLKAQMEEELSVKKLIDISLKLEGLYRHSSTHAAGVVIADRPLDELVPLYRDPKSDMPVVQYSMKYAEIAGLVKFDFLGLKTLTVLAKAVELIGHLGIQIDLLALPMDDAPTFELLKAGKTIGVFQFESAGMRDSLRKLQPDRLEDLIALGALYRPGPMDNIPSYIARKHGREKPDYLHPSLEEVLKETYGVIIYQEQVQKIAQILSGYTLGAADLLRRAMGKKIKAEMDMQRQTFVDGAAKNNVNAKQANEIFDLVAKFAGYGFNKAHAAAYALIGYQTAYLKANYAVEFLAASMTYDMHNTDKLSIFRQDAMQAGIKILPPDINHSCATFTVEHQGDTRHIRYALGALKNVGEVAMQEVEKERETNGAYDSIFDLVARVGTKAMNRRQLEHLVMAGALDGLHSNRAQLCASLDSIHSYGQSVAHDKETSQVSLFGEDSGISNIPTLQDAPDWPPLERLANEYKAIGFYLSSHPLEGYASALKALRVKSYAQANATLGHEYIKIKLAGIVMGRKLKSSARGRFAFIQLSDATGVYEASIFDETLLDTHRELLENGTLLYMNAEAKMEESGIRIIIQGLQALDTAIGSASWHGSALTLTVENAASIDKIAKTLTTPDAKGRMVTLHATLDDTSYAVITLPSYKITPEALMTLQQLPDVEVTEENR